MFLPLFLPEYASLALLAAYMTPDGDGYLQTAFRHPCSSCSRVITKDLLGAVKFCQDVMNPSSGMDGVLA